MFAPPARETRLKEAKRAAKQTERQLQRDRADLDRTERQLVSLFPLTLE
jgi:uncharacterized membrane-anchored protein YhcB (DUF1043 family)